MRGTQRRSLWVKLFPGLSGQIFCAIVIGTFGSSGDRERLLALKLAGLV
jgi:hypothetical protein